MGLGNLGTGLPHLLLHLLLLLLLLHRWEGLEIADRLPPSMILNEKGVEMLHDSTRHQLRGQNLRLLDVKASVMSQILY